MNNTTYIIELARQTARYTVRSGVLSPDLNGWRKGLKIALEYIHSVQALIYHANISEARRAYIEQHLTAFDDILSDREDTLLSCEGKLPEHYDGTFQCAVINTALRLSRSIMRVLPSTL